jgi:protein-S-isoprenylcysteine O-methyltransferase Ste14
MGYQTTVDQTATSKDLFRYIRVNTIMILIFAAALFLSAGTIYWTWGWVVILSLVANMVILTASLWRINPALLAERSRTQEGIKKWDRLLSGIAALFGPASIMLVAGLDYRYHWSTDLPLWAHLAAAATMSAGIALGIWAILSNSFFSGHVRIQVERGHFVVNTGPYHYIRHPGYAAGGVYDGMLPFVLGSFWALIPALLTITIIVIRTWREDDTLKAELDGYREYTNSTRYRLLPGVW